MTNIANHEESRRLHLTWAMRVLQSEERSGRPGYQKEEAEKFCALSLSSQHRQRHASIRLNFVELASCNSPRYQFTCIPTWRQVLRLMPQLQLPDPTSLSARMVHLLVSHSLLQGRFLYPYFTVRQPLLQLLLAST